MAPMSKAKRKDPSNPCQPIRLGYETIYPLQQVIARKAMDMILANEDPRTPNKRSPVITLQMQMGKTGGIEQFVSLFIDDCVARHRTFQIILVCGLSQLDLAAQTRDRLTEGVRPDGVTPFGARLHLKAGNTGLCRYPRELQREGIVILHNSTKLRNLDLNVPVDVRLWITDEVHLGNVKGGNIDVLLRRHGVRINEQIHTWDNAKTVNHFVGVSATPSAHMVLSDNIELQGESLFHWIYEPPPPNYNSIGKMLENNRFKETEALFLPNDRPSEFLARVEADFRKACETRGPGYLVLRALGKKHAKLMAYINRRGRRIECREFDSDPKNNNIDELNTTLSTKPSEPTYVVIKGTMRAGITLGADHYIRGWVETGSINPDSQAQSGPGRACGYDRIGDTYPIYCDIDHVSKWASLYAKLDAGEVPLEIPDGLHNHRTKIRQRYPWKKPYITIEEAQKRFVVANKDNDKRDEHGAKIKGRGAVRGQVSSTSKQIILDVAGLALTHQRDSGATLAYYIDGPTTKATVKKYLARHPKASKERLAEVWAKYHRNVASYRKLIAEHPEVEGKVIVLDTGDNNRGVTRGDDRTRDTLQKRKSAIKVA